MFLAAFILYLTNKMNRLHLHMTDSQAWPLEVPSLPDLAAKGAYGKDSIYSADDLAHIQEYGDMKYVTVYIEIDMPGHTSSIFHAYPELIAAYNVQPNWVDFAAEPPSGTMKLNSSDVYDFLDALWDDVLPRVSQYNSFMHTGGDEINLHAYTLDETVNSEDPGVVRPLLQYFVDKAHGRIREAGLTPIVWEEMLLKYNLTLGNDVLVQTWLGTSSTRKTVEAGHKTIASNADYWVCCHHKNKLRATNAASLVPRLRPRRLARL
jgi:hexosaminidase